MKSFPLCIKDILYAPLKTGGTKITSHSSWTAPFAEKEAELDAQDCSLLAQDGE